MLPEITRRIRPPRALAVPYPLGFPLGEANNAPLQRAILRSLLALCTETAVPIIRDCTGQALAPSEGQAPS